jgi:hypothetical protein
LFIFQDKIKTPCKKTHVASIMTTASLTSLPDDLLLDIVEYLDAARDVSHLGQVAKRTHGLVEHAGWKTFAKTRFPSIEPPPLPPTRGHYPWRKAADRLSHLDRCWDKRAIQLTQFRTQTVPRKKNAARQPRQAVDFHGIVDAHYLSSTHQEVVAWGGGEDLHVRFGSSQGWKSALGKNTNYAAGTGDVTCLRMIERRAGLPEVVVGRANGDVQILSAAEDASFGTPTQALIKLDEREDAALQPFFSISPGRLSVNCAEWQSGTDVLATARSSQFHLYGIPSEGDAGPPTPLAHIDMSRDDQESFIRDIKFLGRDAVAVALGGNSQPVQLGTMRPTGVEFAPAPHNPALLDRQEGKLEPASYADVTGVWAIQPVAQPGAASSNLLLSSWHDGSFRLMDLRTPSPHDAVYRDSFQPYHAGEALLVYGTERFVSSNNTAPALRFFDFRFPKPYFHTTALPCSPYEPQPRPVCLSLSSSSSSAAAAAAGIADRSTGRCTPGLHPGCEWHMAMESPCFRQDGTLWLGLHTMDRVFSLAKASDSSDKFYLGLRGSFAEAQLVLGEDTATQRQQTEAYTCPDGWRVSDMPNVSMAETGISLCTRRMHMGAAHGELHNGMPELLYRCDETRKHGNARVFLDLPERSRFDTTWRQQMPMRQSGRWAMRA